MGIIADRRCVASSITFASGLDPDDSVNEGRTGAQCGVRSEAGTLDVTPISPCTSDVLDTRATLVDDEVSGESS